MTKVRAVFEKTGRAKYISHLDLNRCMLRIFRRSKLPVWYTEGFNPHPYFSFALALSLGFESDCEILDFTLNEELPFDEVRDKMNAVMPEGMRISSVRPQGRKITEIAKAEYELILSSADHVKLGEAVDALMSQPEILIEKKTKKGIKSVDLKPSIELITAEPCGDIFKIVLRLPAGTQTNYNPNLFLDALRNYQNPEFSVEKISRTGILCENNQIFL